MTTQIYESKDFCGSRIRLRFWDSRPAPIVTMTVIGDSGTNATIELSEDECIRLRRALMDAANRLRQREVTA